jgi:membrane-bound lytic murein transglycosylase D
VLRSLFIILSINLLTSITTVAQVRFCGETLPQNLPDVQQRWERALNRQASQTAQLVRLKQRAASFFSVIEPILKRYAIPKDFGYIPLIESVLHPYPTFYGDGAGVWQLTPQQGRKLGLMVAGPGRDQRYDLRLSTVAVSAYLTELYRELGSWALVAAAYQNGPQGVRQLKNEQIYPSYFSSAYHPESKSVLFQAIAVKELMTRPASTLSIGRPAAPVTEQISTVAPPLPRPEAASAPVPVLGPVPTPTVPTVVVASAKSDAASVAAASVTPVSTRVTTQVAVQPEKKQISVTAPASLIQSRSMSRDALTDGQLVIFEVLVSQMINGISVSAGDVVYAHIETIDVGSGRVFLRAYQLLSARTQATTPVNLIAVERPGQPGVAIPPRDQIGAGWRLAWEAH